MTAINIRLLRNSAHFICHRRQFQTVIFEQDGRARLLLDPENVRSVITAASNRFERGDGHSRLRGPNPFRFLRR